jgi:hypothetical protein
METVCFSEILASTDDSTRRQNPENFTNFSLRFRVVLAYTFTIFFTLFSYGKPFCSLLHTERGSLVVEKDDFTEQVGCAKLQGM